MILIFAHTYGFFSIVLGFFGGLGFILRGLIKTGSGSIHRLIFITNCRILRLGLILLINYSFIRSLNTAIFLILLLVILRICWVYRVLWCLASFIILLLRGCIHRTTNDSLILWWWSISKVLIWITFRLGSITGHINLWVRLSFIILISLSSRLIFGVWLRVRIRTITLRRGIYGLLNQIRIWRILSGLIFFYILSIVLLTIFFL